MESTYTLRGILLVGGLVVSLAAPGATAGDRPDVDIESLAGRLYRSTGNWLLEVTYDVEVEHADAAGPLSLVVGITERGYAISDAGGEPVVFSVALDRPTEVDKHELEFESGFSVDLASGLFGDPRKLQLQAAVYEQNSDYPLDEKSSSIKYKSTNHVTGSTAATIFTDFRPAYSASFSYSRSYVYPYCYTPGYPQRYIQPRRYYKPHYRGKHSPFGKRNYLHNYRPKRSYGYAPKRGFGYTRYLRNYGGRSHGLFGAPGRFHHNSR